MGNKIRFHNLPDCVRVVPSTPKDMDDPFIRKVVGDAEMQRAMYERLDEIEREFLIAVEKDALGLFCEKWDLRDLYKSAESHIDLVRLLATWIRELEKEIE